MKIATTIIRPALGLWVAAGALTLLLAAPQPAAAKLMADQKCLKCHSEVKGMQSTVAGEFQSRSNKAMSLVVNVGGEKNIVLKYTKDTTVANVPNIKALKKPIPVRVSYVAKGSDLVATKIVAKPTIKVPEKQLIGVKDLAALVAKGPQAGGFMLLDSRPPIRYNEGHIPGAVMMPFPKMPEMMGKLPKDKSKLLIFYCEGFR
ncbi:MAG: rhodanese-like domain-containing protein [Desulfarculus sp.]|nr:MAG: rhodanese-like domain-containing protein [Desulfarculus sp.]